jgi:hypothetical protein
MWTGALFLSSSILYFSWGVMVEGLRALHYFDFMSVAIFYLSIATVILIS